MPSSVDHHHLARLDVAHELGADDVEGAGFRGQDRRAFQHAQHQRPHAIGIAHADQLLGGQRHQRIGAFDLAQRVDQLVDDARAGTARRQMHDGFGVGGGLEDRALRHQFVAQGVGIGEIAVMRDGQAAARQIGEDGLDVAGIGAAGGGIAHMADREIAFEIARRRGNCGRTHRPPARHGARR